MECSLPARQIDYTSCPPVTGCRWPAGTIDTSYAASAANELQQLHKTGLLGLDFGTTGTLFTPKSVVTTSSVGLEKLDTRAASGGNDNGRMRCTN
jgi:hypothetical protein